MARQRAGWADGDEPDGVVDGTANWPAQCSTDFTSMMPAEAVYQAGGAVA